MKRTLLLVAAAVCLMAGSSQIRRGEWEVTMNPVSLHVPGMTPAQTARLLALIKPTKERYCLADQPKVGDNFIASCTYTKIADRGARIERYATCPAPRGGPPRSATLIGTRSANAFSILDIVTDAKGRKVTMRENGRRIGDCAD